MFNLLYQTEPIRHRSLNQTNQTNQAAITYKGLSDQCSARVRVGYPAMKYLTPASSFGRPGPGPDP
jgi:hypothetical protein